MSENTPFPQNHLNWATAVFGAEAARELTANMRLEITEKENSAELADDGTITVRLTHLAVHDPYVTVHEFAHALNGLWHPELSQKCSVAQAEACAALAEMVADFYLPAEIGLPRKLNRTAYWKTMAGIDPMLKEAMMISGNAYMAGAHLDLKRGFQGILAGLYNVQQAEAENMVRH
jgi:hypothetical protein